MEPFKLT